MSETAPQLSTVSETVELTSGGQVFQTSLNSYLKLGWRIIDQWATGYGDPRERNETLHVLLGWSADQPAQHPEKTVPPVMEKL